MTPRKRQGFLPVWMRLVVLGAVIIEGVALLVGLSGALRGPQGNIVPQAMIGGLVVLLVIAAYSYRYHPENLPRFPSRIGFLLLVAVMLWMTSSYAKRVYPYLSLPYDLASWSEPMFVVDTLKWHNGFPLYLPPDDSNSNPYTPAAPAVTYFLARLAGQPLSIPFYRILLQLYMVLASVLIVATAWSLIRTVHPGDIPRTSRWSWSVLFFLFAFLFATNPQTNAFNIFIHLDPFVLLMAALGFWLMARHAVTADPRWLWAMAVFPAAGFLSKQYLALFAAVYVVYLWLNGSSLRRAVTFGAASFALLGAVLALGFFTWGGFFQYWVFEILGKHPISLTMMRDRLVEALPYLFPGFAGGVFLLGSARGPKIVGLWVAWLIMVLAGVYSSGITFSPTHLGPATIAGTAFFLAALFSFWTAEDSEAPPARHWLSLSSAIGGVTLLLLALGFASTPRQKLPADLFRYASQIEMEFSGIPAERVLLDYGEWIYLRHGVLQKDRAPLLLTHRQPHFGIIERIRNRYYKKILVRVLLNGKYSYELGMDRGIDQELREHYREVRRIDAAQGTENWRYHWMLLSQVIVLEPRVPHQVSMAKPVENAATSDAPAKQRGNP